MARTWREVGSRLVRYGRWAAPPLISAGLVTWLVWRITPGKLVAAALTPASPWLVLATLVQVIVLFLWDTVCVWWLFSRPDRPLSFRLVLRARTDTVLWSAINLEIGQGAFAWRLARATQESVTRALGRCLLLALFDLGTLQSLALVGSFLTSDPRIHALRWICVAAVLGLLGLVAVLKLLPKGWYGWLAAKDWAHWLTWWTWRDALTLWALRLVMFLLVLLYAGVGLFLCGIPTDVRAVVAVIPFVLIAESLPGTAGLGERETALIYLLHAPGDRQATLLCFGLIWSTVVILGRVAIGLVSWCLPHRPSRGEDESRPGERDTAPAGRAVC